jgi:hypothetical protein
MREPLTEYERGKMDGYQEGFEGGRERGFADGYSAGYEAANEELEAAMDEEDRKAIEEFCHDEYEPHYDDPELDVFDEEAFDDDYSESPSWDEYDNGGYDEDPSHY